MRRVYRKNTNGSSVNISRLKIWSDPFMIWKIQMKTMKKILHLSYGQKSRSWMTDCISKDVEK